MRWSKLKKLVEDRFAPDLKGRATINSAAYGNCQCGHAWLSVDQQIVANFCTRAFWNRALGDEDSLRVEDDRWVSDAPVPESVTPAQARGYGEMAYGELSRQDAYQSCWEFVHDLAVEDALISNDPLIQSLAVLDSRLGRRRLLRLQADTTQLHPLARRMLGLRLQSIAQRGIAPSEPNPRGTERA